MRKEVIKMAKSRSGGGKAGADNRANQLNRNNNVYWQERGYKQRPNDWQSRKSQGQQNPKDKGK